MQFNYNNMPELTKLGKYELRRELGKGAMGVVYEGFDPFIERTVAIKTVLKSSLDGSEAQEVLSRFRREAQAAGRLSHPNIVSIYEYGEDQDVAFIVMEFVRGKELKKYFDSEERFQIPDVVRIMSQLLEALEYSHSHGVVHRDIKPANIIIANNGQVKVADFGIARIESSHLTQAGAVLGTPTHMSPEQFMGLAVDRRTDIYSAGVILYQFLTGERPFTGSVVTIMHKALNQEPVPPSALNFSVTAALDNVVKKAMAKRLDERFQTAREFKEALKLAVEGNPVAANETDADATDTYDIVAAPVEAVSVNADVDLWNRVRFSQNPADIQRYLAEYPDGKFAELAGLRITAFEAEAEAKVAALRKKEADENAAREHAAAQAKEEAEARRKRVEAEIAWREIDIAKAKARALEKAEAAGKNLRKAEETVQREAAEARAGAKARRKAKNKPDSEQAMIAASANSSDEMPVAASAQSYAMIAAGGAALLVFGLGIWFALRTSPEQAHIATIPGNPVAQSPVPGAPADKLKSMTVTQSKSAVKDRLESAKAAPHLKTDKDKTPVGKTPGAEAESRRLAQATAEAEARAKVIAETKRKTEAEAQAKSETGARARKIETDTLIRIGIGADEGAATEPKR